MVAQNKRMNPIKSNFLPIYPQYIIIYMYSPDRPLHFDKNHKIQWITSTSNGTDAHELLTVIESLNTQKSIVKFHAWESDLRMARCLILNMGLDYLVWDIITSSCALSVKCILPDINLWIYLFPNNMENYRSGTTHFRWPTFYECWTWCIHYNASFKAAKFAVYPCASCSHA